MITNLLKIPLFILPTGFLLMFGSCAVLETSKDSNTGAPAGPSCFQQLGSNTEWSSETEVEIDGYSQNAMEPKMSADQVVLFWNDKPASDDAMNIHYAVKQGSGRYLYIGTLPGTVSTTDLDGVPSIDSLGNFYFTSLRTYTSNKQSIFGGQISVLGPNSLQVVSVAAADSNVSFQQNGRVDMDVDVSWNGTLMIASRAVFSGQAYPDTSYLELFNVSSRVANVLSTSSDILKNVNLSACRVYAPSLSSDLLELYYTVIPTNIVPGPLDLKVVVSKRGSTSEPFGTGAIISGITGELTEGPAITYDDGGKTLFYHKKDPASGRFKIFKVSRP